jgi:hypothetical protein
MKIIQLGQSSRQGKDLFADYFIQSAEAEGKKVFRTAYADELKNICCKRFNISRDELEFEKNNSQQMIDRIVEVGDEYRIQDETYFVRHLNDKIRWAEVEGFDYAIITDLRFPIEWRRDAVKIQIIRPGFGPKSKVDNQLISGGIWDYYVKNEHTKEHLASQAYSIYKDIERKN